MPDLNLDRVEAAIMVAINEVKERLKINVTIDGDVCPGSIGIKSQVLVSVIRRLGPKLGIDIPDGCYLFHDTKTKRQLSIREASQKLIKVIKDGKGKI